MLSSEGGRECCHVSSNVLGLMTSFPARSAGVFRLPCSVFRPEAPSEPDATLSVVARKCRTAIRVRRTWVFK